jgi:uncharacterized membrane protein YcjF (UPF0283 family)
MKGEMQSYHLSAVGRLFKIVKTGFIAFCGFVVFVGLVEGIQAYQVLHNLHPVFGWLFAIAVISGLIGAIAYYVAAMSRLPAVLIPPPRQDLHSMSKTQAKRHARYLTNVLLSLSVNPMVPEEQKQQLIKNADSVTESLRSANSAEDLIPIIEDNIENVIRPAVHPLDEEAERRVSRCVRDTMLGVTVSPWRSMDLVVVLYRNAQMVVEIARIYNGRPRLREQASIFADVIRVAATVQFLNIGSKLMENMTSWIPVLGRFTDDIAQGIGAGLFTSVAGHAAIDRCRSFQGWDEVEAKKSMGSKLRFFMADLKGIVGDVVMPALKGRIEAELPEERRTPNMLEKAKTGISEAIDVTNETIGSFVKKPVYAGYRGVAKTGTHMWSATRRVGSGIGHGFMWTGKQSAQVSVKGAKAVGKGAVTTSRGIARGSKAVAHGASSMGKGIGRGVMTTGKKATSIFRRKNKGVSS